MLRLNYRIILGSASPRRAELLEKMDINFLVKVSNVEEIIPDGLPTESVPEYLAQLKAFGIKIEDGDLLITADSIVVQDGELLGKPKSKEEAKVFLAKISNSSHHVISGVYLKSKDREYGFSATTEVHIAKISTEEMDYYVDNYDALDKAGAYGIQEWIGWVKVSKIIGSYPNVMGLPTDKLYLELMKW